MESALSPAARGRFTYREERSKELHRQDRSAIYGMFHLYEMAGGPAGEMAGGPAGEMAGGRAGEMAGGPAGEMAGGPAGEMAGGPAAGNSAES